MLAPTGDYGVLTLGVTSCVAGAGSGTSSVTGTNGYEFKNFIIIKCSAPTI